MQALAVAIVLIVSLGVGLVAARLAFEAVFLLMPQPAAPYDVVLAARPARRPHINRRGGVRQVAAALHGHRRL
jgi:hypothetical protein